MQAHVERNSISLYAPSRFIEVFLFSRKYTHFQSTQSKFFTFFLECFDWDKSKARNIFNGSSIENLFAVDQLFSEIVTSKGYSIKVDFPQFLLRFCVCYKIRNQPKPYTTCHDQPKPLKKQPQPGRTIQNQPKAPKTTNNQTKAPATA